MITLGNRYDLTESERRESLFRAMHTQPFFNLLKFPVDDVGARVTDYGSKLNVDKDFYVTEIAGNFNEVNSASGFTETFTASFYASLNQGSLYKWSQTQRLPVGFICNELREGDITFATQQYDDRQFELIPYRIKNGDSLIGTVKSVGGGEKSVDVDVVFKGYYILPNAHLSENTTRGVNESLARPIRFETWSRDIAVDHVSEIETIKFDNDRTARMVLGFGLVETTRTTARRTIEIVDNFRNIKWTNEPLPIQALAPKINNAGGGCRDIHIYYLPTEYLLEPFASLQCAIRYISGDVETNATLVMLTRTV